MADSRRSGDQSGVVVKNRSSSGCLIVRKKSDDVSVAGSSGARKALGSKKGKKRPRVVTNDSGSSDDLLVPPRRRVGPETIRVCNDLSGLEMGAEEESNFGKEKDRDRLDLIRRNEDGLYGRTVGQSDRKRNKLDVFEFDESEGSDKEEMMRQKLLDDARMDIGGRRFFEGSMALGRGGIEREFETGSNRQVLVEKRKNLHLERTSSFNQGGMNRFGVDRNPGRKPISSLREKYAGDSDEPIRLQGKNGVLKVMVNKKKKVSEPVKTIDHVDAEETRSSSRIEEKAKRNVPIHPSLYSETEILEKPGSSRRTEKKLFKTRKSLSSKNSKDDDSDSNDSATVMNLGPKRKEACKSKKEASSESEKTPVGNPMLSRIKEGKVTRGSGTEKQKLRERIRGMLVEAGWTIDYRPRKNRDYLDAVYINPAGTAYWSIIKAYDALMKQLNDEEDEAKHIADCSPFTPLPDEVLSQLTRKTRKKIEKEMRKKQIDVCQSLNRREPSARRTSSARHDDDSTGSDEHEEKLSSFLKQGGKSSKSKMNENGVVSQNLKGQSSSHLLETDVKPSLTSSSHLLHGRKSKKLGRCTLLVRSTNEGSNSGTDGFVPYTGKRTLLSWLIDSGTVQLSQKVQYMNRRRTKVLLEGWVTRDGIHCGCCSKILTVSKFEIHAGSKLRQPFQNIYLDLGVSLLQCQIDAWTRLEESESIGFDRVDTNGDDPNDDTCGICGDGGNLICCDGCPSTFHQSCLDIQILPPGDWHCPNCTCKFCGLAGEDFMEVDGTTTSSLLTCNICEKKYHKLCMQEVGVSDNLTGSATSFCGHKCLELSEHLQKYLGVKHELESGFSWSLIHRSDEDSDTSLRGLPHRVECNAKLAVALTVMDECFLPIVDRRSGINLIRNVLYNSGSNFSRLNYSGFYTAILERGDEIISAASIRFHGTQLAEMPFIGTRHIYRHQGMCRRLFCALESALCTLKVEKLIIPAIAELRHTWTVVFGFTPLEESLRREIRSLNVLVFPGVDMLQKRLVEQDGITNISGLRGLKQKELKAKHETTPEMANKANIESSSESKSLKSGGSDLLHSNAINGAIDATDFDSKFLGISSNSTSTPSGLSPVHVSDEGTYADSNAADKLVESASVGKGHFESDTSQIRATEVKPESDSTAVDITQSTKAVDMDVDHAVDVYISAEVAVTKSIKEVNMDVDHAANVNISASHEYENPITTEEITSPDSQTQNDLDISDLNQKRLFTGDTSHDAPRKGNEPEFVSPVDRNTPFATECDIDNECDTAFTADGSHEVKVVVSVQETPATDSRDKSPESASAINCASNPENISGVNMENEQVSDSPVECNIEPCKDADDMVNAGSIEDNFAAAPEVGIVVSVEGTVCSDSRPEDKLTESASIRSFIFDKSPCMPHGKSNAVDLFVKDESQSCKEDDMNDSPAIDVDTTAREFVQPISVQGFKSIELYCGDELAEAGVQSCREGGLLDVSAETESASERDCVVSKTDAYEQYREHNPSSDSPHCKLDNSDDKHPNAAPPREITVKNTSEAGSGISAYASTRLGGSDMISSMHVVNGQKSTTSSESGSEAAHREASSHHPSSDVPKDNNEPSFA